MGIEWHGDDPGFKSDLNKEMVKNIQYQTSEWLKAGLSKEQFDSISFFIRSSNAEAIVDINGPEPAVEVATAILIKHGIKVD